MVIRKISKMNSKGVKGLTIPTEMLEDMGLNGDECYVNIERVGNSLHVNRVEVVV
jgi:antitoxin component of MazEF toxin-antitoxin module